MHRLGLKYLCTSTEKHCYFPKEFINNFTLLNVNPVYINCIHMWFFCIISNTIFLEGNRFVGVAKAANKRRLKSEIDENTDIATSASREVPAVLADQESSLYLKD